VANDPRVIIQPGKKRGMTAEAKHRYGSNRYRRGRESKRTKNNSVRRLEPRTSEPPRMLAMTSTPRKHWSHISQDVEKYGMIGIMKPP